MPFSIIAFISDKQRGLLHYYLVPVQTYLGVIVEVGFLFGVFPGYHA